MNPDQTENGEDTAQGRDIACGIAGWSYPDWKGCVYPPGTKDTLRYVAQYVDVIEINSSFYRPPAPRTTESWVARTADLKSFCFTAKIHQDITHGRRLEDSLVSVFREGITPLVEAGKLRHLLAQFRYDFAHTPATRELLVAVNRAFGDLCNLVVELRDSSWQAPQAQAFLEELGVTVANLDYPLSRRSFSMRLCPVGRHAYLRLHGRNSKAWFDKKAGRDETYNYYYKENEVADIVRRALALRKQSQSVTVIANNHFEGKEVANALQIKSAVQQKRVPVPPQLADKYPELARIRTD